MVINTKMREGDGESSPPVNLLNSAIDNDVAGLTRALEDGQSLDLVDEQTGFNIIMIAMLEFSEDFLREAIRHHFNVWHRDKNYRLAIDHANALGLVDIQKALYNKMYPPGWAARPITIGNEPK